MKLVRKKTKKPGKPIRDRYKHNKTPEEPKVYEVKDILRNKRHLRRKLAQIKAHKNEIERLMVEANALQNHVTAAELQFQPVKVLPTIQPKSKRKGGSRNKTITTDAGKTVEITDEIAARVMKDLIAKGLI